MGESASDNYPSPVACKDAINNRSDTSHKPSRELVTELSTVAEKKNVK